MMTAPFSAQFPALIAAPARSSGSVGYAGARADTNAAKVTESGMDEASLAATYRKYAPAILAHCRRLLRSPAAARDATQEAFVRVMSRGPSALAGEDALRYLYRVATNVCLNQLRERRVHERAVPALAAHSSRSPSVEGTHANRQFVTALLDRCDETGAAIAVMFYMDGASQVEIAETLGITRRTVWNRLRKLEALAAELLGEPPPRRAADESAGDEEGT